jgi:anti-repressor protein
MNKLFKIRDNVITIKGRELHEYLESKEPYEKWFNNMLRHGFKEFDDYTVLEKEHDHALSINMAKHICIIYVNKFPSHRLFNKLFYIFV